MKFNPFRSNEPDMIEDNIETWTGAGKLDSMWRQQVPDAEWEGTAEMLYAQTQYTDMLKWILKDLYRKVTDKETKSYGARNFSLTRAHIDGYKKALQDIHRVLPQTRK